MDDRKPLTETNMIIFAAELRHLGKDKPYPVAENINDRLVITRWLNHTPPSVEQSSSQSDIRPMPDYPEHPLSAAGLLPTTRPTFRAVAEGTVPEALRIAARQRNAESDARKPPSTAEIALGEPMADTSVDNGSSSKSGSPDGDKDLSSNKTITPRRFMSVDASAEDKPAGRAGPGHGPGHGAKAASN